MWRTVVTASLWWAAGTGAAAQTFHESGEAGQTLATSQVVAEGMREIQGRLHSAGDVDLYRLRFDQAMLVTVRTTAAVDANLMLFDAAGHGLWGDDNSGGGNRPLIVWFVTPGIYHLAVGENDIVARNAASTVFCSNDDGDCSANTVDVLDHFQASGSSAGMSYQIVLSQPTARTAAVAAVPGLTVWGVLALALALGAAGAVRVRRGDPA